MLVYRCPRRELTLCPQLCMGIRPGARFPALRADGSPATPYGHFTGRYTEIGLVIHRPNSCSLHAAFVRSTFDAALVRSIADAVSAGGGPSGGPSLGTLLMPPSLQGHGDQTFNRYERMTLASV